jgi:hypothetical protein
VAGASVTQRVDASGVVKIEYSVMQIAPIVLKLPETLITVAENADIKYFNCSILLCCAKKIPISTYYMNLSSTSPVVDIIAFPSQLRDTTCHLSSVSAVSAIEEAA